MPTARQLGARWLHFTGGSIKFTAAGAVDYKTMDYEVNTARSLGMGVVMSLGGIEGACTNQSGAAVTSCPPTSQQDLARYSQYLPRLLLHFRGRVDYFESWVEPNHRSFWPGGPNPDQYATLLKTEWAAFQAANQRHGLNDKLLFASVADFGIAPNSPSGIAVLPFTRRVLDDLAGAKAFDAVALHAYRFPPSLAPDDQGQSYFPAAPNWRPQSWSAALASYEQEFTDHGYGQPDLWLTELGWPGNTSAGDSYHPSEAAQATDMQQAFRDLRALPFVRAAFWFNLRDYEVNHANPDPGFFAHYGLLHNDFSPKPAAQVFTGYARAG